MNLGWIPMNFVDSIPSRSNKIHANSGIHQYSWVGIAISTDLKSLVEILNWTARANAPVVLTTAATPTDTEQHCARSLVVFWCSRVASSALT